MANILYDSFLNPVKFHQLDNIQPDNYVSRFMDDWAFRRTIQPWDQKVCFYQPWGNTDQVCLQYTSNFGGIILRMYDEDGLLVHTQAFVNMQQDELRPLFYIRQIQVNLNAFAPGKYFFTRDAAGAITYSEPFEILDQEDSGVVDIENPHPTLYIEYSHYEPTGGLKFFPPFAPKLRVPGILQYKSPGSKDNIYEDQLLNQTLVNSVSFRILQLIIGGRFGVPPWFIDKVARILGCSDTSFDGRLLTKSEGTNFEPTLIEGYPMAAWAIDLREKLNRDSQVIENDVVIEGIAAAAIIVDNEGFGISSGSTSYQEIISLQ